MSKGLFSLFSLISLISIAFPLLALLLPGAPAHAGPMELARLLDSPMASLLLRETTEGTALVERLIGRRLGSEADQAALKEALARAEEAPTARRLEERLSDLRDHLDLSSSEDPQALLLRAGETELRFVDGPASAGRYADHAAAFMESATFPARVAEFRAGAGERRLADAFFWMRIKPLKPGLAVAFIDEYAARAARLEALAIESKWKGSVERETLVAAAKDLESKARSMGYRRHGQSLPKDALRRLEGAFESLREVYDVLGLGRFPLAIPGD